jgi:hypothetical protein
MKVSEGFCGFGSCSNVAEELGYKTFRMDKDTFFKADFYGDLTNEEDQNVFMEQVKDSDIVWLSPPCKVWSLSSGNTYWTKFRQPRNEEAILGIRMMMFCRYVADYCVKHNKIFFIENPNGRAVWILENKYLKRSWYCQYGDSRAKPTNIWTNLDITFKTCFNSNPNCNHERAVRGSKTGTQGLKNSKERSRIPKELFIHIFNRIEELKLRKI